MRLKTLGGKPFYPQYLSAPGTAAPTPDTGTPDSGSPDAPTMPQDAGTD